MLTSYRKRPWIIWLLVVAYMATLFYLSSLTGSEVGLSVPDYVAHASAYFGLGFLLYLGLRSLGRSPKQAAILAVFLSVVYGVTDEIHQSFVPGRDPSISDILSDAVGAILAQTAIYAVRKVLMSKSGK